MDTSTIVQLAMEIHAHTGHSFVIINAGNTGASHHWAEAFPSLTADQRDKLDKLLALRFSSVPDAQTAYSELCKDASDEDVSFIYGTITYIGPDWRFPIGEDDTPASALEFQIEDDRERPTFENHHLVFTAIPHRL